MSKKKRLIPFRLTPASIGLVGKTYEKAKAEYELSGYDLETKLAEIEYSDDKESFDYKKAMVKINRKYDRITERTYIELMGSYSEKEKSQIDLELLEYDYKNKVMNDQAYEKQKATLNKEPWVNVVEFKLDRSNPSMVGEVELDWNEFFIQELQKKGYVGQNDHVIIHKWFELICSAIATEGGLVNPIAGATDSLPPVEPGIKEYR